MIHRADLEQRLNLFDDYLTLWFPKNQMTIVKKNILDFAFKYQVSIDYLVGISTGSLQIYEPTAEEFDLAEKLGLHFDCDLYLGIATSDEHKYPIGEDELTVYLSDDLPLHFVECMQTEEDPNLYLKGHLIEASFYPGSFLLEQIVYFPEVAAFGVNGTIYAMHTLLAQANGINSLEDAEKYFRQRCITQSEWVQYDNIGRNSKNRTINICLDPYDNEANKPDGMDMLLRKSPTDPYSDLPLVA